MTRLLFIRHAKPDFSDKNDYSRPLTEEGKEKSKELVEVFKERKIDAFYSSPYIRSVNTIQYLADSRNMKINLCDNLRERKVSNTWIEDFWSFAEKQWADFNYKEISGESLKEVQDRNIIEIKKILEQHKNESIVIGTHGTSLCSILNYYDKNKIDFEYFKSMSAKMPFCIELNFNGQVFQSMLEIN